MKNQLLGKRRNGVFATEGTEPSPQRTQSGQGVWLRVLGLDLSALCENSFVQEGVMNAGGRVAGVIFFATESWQAAATGGEIRDARGFQSGKGAALTGLG